MAPGTTDQALQSAAAGTLYGIGLGPGDPELLTMKAVRLIKSAAVIAYFAKKGRRGHARGIVDAILPEGKEEIPLYYPITTEVHFSDPSYISAVGGFYNQSASEISAKLLQGKDVALLCEGDPLFYGSFMHIFIRLKENFRIDIVPGVTGMSGCWTAAGQPITWGDDILTVLPGTLPANALIDRLKSTDAAVIMKLGTNFAKVRAALADTGLLDRAFYVERGTMAGQHIIPLAEKGDETAPYFSLILVPGHGRRP